MPKFIVEISSAYRKTYEVEAPSIHHVKEMYQSDEKNLGTPVDTEVSYYDMAVCPIGGAPFTDESEIAELIHLADENGDPLCGDKAGAEWVTTPQREYVNCPLCLEKADSVEPTEKR